MIRKIGNEWIDDFNTFSRKQWENFDYKLTDGESLNEVQSRNIKALGEVLTAFKGKNVVIGSHGTALSTIINYYNKAFGFSDFERIKNLMPWVVKFAFDDDVCVDIQSYNLCEISLMSYTKAQRDLQ